jgi:hypothetical protein
MIYYGPVKSTLVHNEQMKLYATACNNLSVACVVSGLLVPMFGGPGNPLLFFVGGQGLALVLHFLAHLAVAHLREDGAEGA